MESYYSSDEEIAWGPVSIREIKSDLKRTTVRKPSRRHTILCNIENTEMEEPHSEETNKLCLSGASTAYYSPNESFKTNANSDFLEKLSQVINIPSPDLSEYASILEDTENSQHQTKDTKSQNELLNIPHNFVADQGERNYNDTCTNFIKASAVRDTHYDIENFQQTLVENTYIVSEEEEEQINEEHSMDENSFCGEKEFVNDEEEQVIIISDESSSSVGDSEGDDLNYDKKSITFEREVSSDSHTNKTIKSEKIECKCEIYKDNLEENIQEQSNEDKIKSHQGDKLYEVQKKEDSCHHEEDSVESLLTSNVQHKLSTIKEYLSTSPVIVPEINLTQFDDSVKDDALQLNDTFEEITRLLNQGLNYSMSDDEDIDNTPVKKYLTPQEFITPSNQIIPNKQLFSGTKEKASHIPRLKYEPTSSEKKQTIKCTVTKDSSKPNFKIPGLPPRSKLTHTTPQKACPNLKDIVSPVALYIKNSPRFPLKQNVPLKELPKIVTSTSISTKSANKANLFAEMPEVIYKPSKKQIVSTEKHIVIPPYMRKLNIRVAQITKHEGRINHESDRSKVSEKLLLADITNRSIDQSLLDSTGDISVLTNKQAFIK